MTDIRLDYLSIDGHHKHRTYKTLADALALRVIA